MNTIFREVVREVLIGLLIMEQHVKRSTIRRRCPGMKRVPKWSGFALGCHTQSMREREKERERERERNRKHNQNKVPTIEKRRYVCMKNA